jgi:carboxyl-terminal processing protease
MRGNFSKVNSNPSRGQIKSWHAFLRPFLFAAVMAFQFLWPLAPASFRTRANFETPPVSTATHEGRMTVFDDVWATISERYYDRDFSGLAKGLTWDAQRSTFRALAAETSSGPELYAVLRRMISSLNDPHTRVFPPAEKFDWWRPRFVTIGLTVKEVAGLPAVVQVERGSAPQRAGIVPGDIIEAVNDQPALSLLQRRLNDGIALSVPARSRAFATLVDGPPESLVEIRWKGRDGKSKSAQFKRYWRQRELGLRVQRKNDFAIIEMDAFTREIAYNFVLALRENLTNVRGIVLDLRSNGGGDAEAMTDVGSAFLGSGFSLGRFIDRSGTSFALFTRRKSALIPERLARTDLPLVVLTSERTSSAAEILTAGLRASRRATVIGTETCGCVLAIRTRHGLPDGGLLDISEMDYQTANGERLERHGIKPDTTIMLQRNDLYSGRDRGMELAITKLKNHPQITQISQN